jgi:MHS family proline/betaine transporter-like MFS transporter
LLVGPLGIIGFYIRLKIEDTPEFRSIEETGSVSGSPLKEVVTRNGKEIVQAGAIEAMMNVAFYIVLVYLLTYQESTLGWSASRAAMLSSVTSIVAVIIVPLAGSWSDRIGRKPLLIGAAIALIILSYPLFAVMNMDVAWAGIASTIGLGIILAVILGVHAVTSAELFPTRTRQSGMSIAYQGGTALFAGTAPYIITGLISITGNGLIPAFYLMMIGVIGLVALLTIQESVASDLLQKDRSISGPKNIPGQEKLWVMDD